MATCQTKHTWQCTPQAAQRHNNTALKKTALKNGSQNIQVKRGDFILQRLRAFRASRGTFYSHQNQSLLPNARRFEHTFWLKSATCQGLFIYFVGGWVGAVSSGDVHSLSLSMLQNVCFHPSLKRVKAAWCYLLSAHPNATLPQSLCPTSHDRSQAINLCMFWQLHRLKASLQQRCHSVFKCWARVAVHAVEKCQNSANSAVSVNHWETHRFDRLLLDVWVLTFHILASLP